MDPLLTVITNPLAILLIAVGVFTGRVYYMARHLKSAVHSADLADLMALDKHRESLAEAKEAFTGNLGGARETLRTYKRSLDRARVNRLGDIIHSLGDEKRDFEKVRTQPAFKDAKKLVKDAIPRKGHRSPTKEM